METIENDYYKVLGVPENADEETIKKAYKEIVKKYHPDNNPNNIEAERKFREAGEAYDILGDPNKRKEYDLSRHKKSGITLSATNFSNKEMESIFHSVFGFSYFDIQKNIKNNEKAYDAFQEFYEVFKEKYYALTSGIRNNMEAYCDKKNRCKYAPDELAKLKKKMENSYAEKLQEKTQNLLLLEEKLQRRNIELDSYLGKRQKNGVALTKENVTTYQLSQMLESMDLMDEIDSYLIALGITIEAYLKSRGKTLEEIKRNELQVIRDTLKEHSENLRNTMEENLEESSGRKSIS